MNCHDDVIRLKYKLIPKITIKKKPKSVTTIPSAKLMRELLKLGLLNSQLIVPLTSDDG